ncbi:NAD-P-binding protein [Lactarius tabidus]
MSSTTQVFKSHDFNSEVGYTRPASAFFSASGGKSGTASKLILVLGATGAQGRAVVNSFLAPSEDGTSSPYLVRVLSHNPESKHVLSLGEYGVVFFKGKDLASVAAALDGVHGAWVNTDGITIGEQHEIYQKKSLRHYVWSSLNYNLKLSQQPSVVISRSVVTSGPYMDMLQIRIGYFARYTFDHRTERSGKNLEMASEWAGWEHLVATFTKVMGHNAVYNRETLEEWLAQTENAVKLVAAEGAPGSIPWAENFSGWWNAFRDDLNKRDMGWIRKINPNGYTLERWMIEI